MYHIPKQYSVYQRIIHDNGSTEWVGVHRLPIAAALRYMREFRDRGYRVTLRLDGEMGPTYKD